jgi:hypothetical protein
MWPWRGCPVCWCKSKTITIINKMNSVLSSRRPRTNCGIIRTRISDSAPHADMQNDRPAKSSDILEAWCSKPVSNTSVTPACQDLDWYLYCFSLWKGLGSLPTDVAALQFIFRLHDFLTAVHSTLRSTHTPGSSVTQLCYCSRHILLKRVHSRFNCTVLH